MPWRVHEITMAAGSVLLSGWLVYALAQPTPSLQSRPGIIVNMTVPPSPVATTAP